MQILVKKTQSLKITNALFLEMCIVSYTPRRLKGGWRSVARSEAMKNFGEGIFILYFTSSQIKYVLLSDCSSTYPSGLNCSSVSVVWNL